ncbi:MAG: winged helix-turn-helix transcriptional regulator [Gammaproteobacteria bacterium]|nr:winged helix-turn-helix transcriptional regulator [Gammaproteobacteria bacterium]
MIKVASRFTTAVEGHYPKFRARKFRDSDLIDYIRNNPSVTIKQIAEHFSVKPSSVQSRLKALKITYKKNISVRRKR